MVKLPRKWITELASKPESGMGYQVVSVTLKGGKRFEQVIVVDGKSQKFEAVRTLHLRPMKSSKLP